MDCPSPKRRRKSAESSADEEISKSEEATDDSQWENLPINCLVSVFQRLSLYELTLGVPFVCKSWYEASLDPSCWKILDFSNIDPWQRGSTFAEKFKHEYRLDEFQFRGFLDFIMHRSRKLAVLLIEPSRESIPLRDLVYILQECPKLDIHMPPVSTNNPGLMRKVILNVHSTLLQRVTNCEVMDCW